VYRKRIFHARHVYFYKQCPLVFLVKKRIKKIKKEVVLSAIGEFKNLQIDIIIIVKNIIIIVSYVLKYRNLIQNIFSYGKLRSIYT
jgi:hypothetical protein